MKAFLQWVRRDRYFMLFVLCFGLFSLGTAGTEITRIDLRFALMVEDMKRFGIGFFPTINGVPYPDYPVPWIFCSWLTTLGGNWVNQWSLALPSMLGGAYLIALTARIGDQVRPGIGLAAAAFSMLSPEYLMGFLGFGIDIPVAAAAATAIFLLENPSPRPRRWVAVFGLLTIAFAVRGGLGIIVAGAAVTGYLAGCRRWRDMLLFWLIGGIAAVTGIAVSIGLIFRQGGAELLRDCWHWQIASRIGRGNDLFYYFTSGMASFAPLTPVAVLLLVMTRRAPEPKLAGLIGWALLPMLLLSIPSCKHLRYITLTLPAFALIAAWCLEKMTNLNERLRGIRRFALGCGIAALATVAGLLTVGVIRQEIGVPYWHGALAVGGILLFQQLLREDKLLLCAGLGAVVTALAIFPFEAMLENSRDFVAAVEAKRQGKVCFFELGPDHDDLKYVFHTAPSRRGDILYLGRTASDPESLLARMYPTQPADRIVPGLTESDRIILAAKDFPKLQALTREFAREVVVVGRGRMGHRTFYAAKIAAKIVGSGRAAIFETMEENDDSK